MEYSTRLGTVQRWVLTSHIIAHCELELEERVLANSHSGTKDITKSWMNFHKSCVDLLLEVLKGWANPINHWESPIHISSCVEASHTVQNDWTYAKRIGLEETAVKIAINTKEKFTIIAAERRLFGRLLILAKFWQSLSLEFVWYLGLPDGGIVNTCKSRLLGVSFIQVSVFFNQVKNNKILKKEDLFS